MNIPEFWARAEVDDSGAEAQPGRGMFIAFGWSHESMVAAHKMAIERAKNTAKWIATQQRSDWAGPDTARPGGDSYRYAGDRPPREEIIDRNDEHGWILTRNSYGSVILNAAHVMFVDLDLDSTLAGQQVHVGCLGALFGGGGSHDARSPGANPHAALGVGQQLKQFIEKIADVVQSLDGMGVRLYQTAAGFRAVVTTEPYDPTHDLTHDMMHAFGVDPKYANLCRVQESFRARLTPKPWRIAKLGNPPVRFPFRNAGEVTQYERWLAKYNMARVGTAVCRHVDTIGSSLIDEQVRPVLDLHDRFTLSEGDPLA